MRGQAEGSNNFPMVVTGIVSGEFPAEVRGLKFKNVAVELLEKLLDRRNQSAFKAKSRSNSHSRRRVNCRHSALRFLDAQGRDRRQNQVIQAEPAWPGKEQPHEDDEIKYLRQI